VSVVEVLAIGAAGGLGAVARFVLDGVIRARTEGPLPVGTMTINISGSALLGLLTGLVLAAAVPASSALVLGTGFLGGYTTFSTASSETVRLLQAGRTRVAILSGAGTALLSLAGAGLGLWAALLLT
jgi:CrcB protein